MAAQPKIVEVTDDSPRNPVGTGLPEAGRSYPVIMGDYTAQQAVWKRIDVQPGTPLNKPKPLFAKLDPELAETGRNGQDRVMKVTEEKRQPVTAISLIAVAAVLLTSVNLRSPVSSFSPIADQVSRI